jgi:hypothetical protein
MKIEAVRAELRKNEERAKSQLRALTMSQCHWQCRHLPRSSAGDGAPWSKASCTAYVEADGGANRFGFWEFHFKPLARSVTDASADCQNDAIDRPKPDMLSSSSGLPRMACRRHRKVWKPPSFGLFR